MRSVTVGQYLASFAVVAALVTAILALAASRSWRVLVLATALFLAAAVAYFVRTRGTGGPGVLRSSIVAAVALAVGALIAHWRRKARTPMGRFASGVLTWAGIVFAWFETAYLLR